MIDLPGMIHPMFSLMHHLRILRVRMAGRIYRTGGNRRSRQEPADCNADDECHVVCHVYASLTIPPLLRTVSQSFTVLSSTARSTNAEFQAFNVFRINGKATSHGLWTLQNHSLPSQPEIELS